MILQLESEERWHSRLLTFSSILRNLLFRLGAVRPDVFSADAGIPMAGIARLGWAPTSPGRFATPPVPAYRYGVPKGEGKDCNIEPRTHALYVIQVVSEFIRCVIQAIVHLSQTRQSGTNPKTGRKLGDLLFQSLMLLHVQRPGSNQAHVTPANIEELRKLV